jgi:nitrogen fixation protein FixH
MSLPFAAPAAPRPITGRTVLLWIVAFFVVIFAANAVFIYLAVSTFPGLEVASSYKAGQAYESDVAAARAQGERGWVVEAHAALAAEGATIDATFVDRDGRPLSGLAVTATFGHTVDTAHDQSVTLSETAPGTYSGKASGIVPGQWSLILSAAQDGERQFMSRNLVMLAL